MSGIAERRSSLTFDHASASLSSPTSPNETLNASKKYKCNVCSSSFQRREHYERHLRRHSRIRDFHCELCSKSFARRDTMQRHLATHGQEYVKDTNTLQRASRACVSCVKSKQRCTGSQPCERCSRRGWQCQFLNKSRDIQYPNLEDAQSPSFAFSQSEAPKNTDLGSTTESHSFSWASPVSTRQSSGTLGASGQFPTDELYAGFPSDSNTGQHHIEPNAICESFLLWPFLDGFDSCNLISPFASGHEVDLTLAGRSELSNSVSTTADTSGTLGLIPQGSLSDRIFSELPSPFSGTRSEICAENQSIPGDDLDVLIAEDYGHVRRPSDATYDSICSLCLESVQNLPAPHRPTLPSLDVLHVCVQLYFEHFHKTFPFLHQATFEARTDSWLLYLAVAAVGSQYSRFSDRVNVTSSMLRIIREALLHKLRNVLILQNNLELAQATLLFTLCLLLGGSQEGIMYAQYQRNMLITICRPLFIPTLLFRKNNISSRPALSTTDWLRWIKDESWKRLAYYTWGMYIPLLVGLLLWWYISTQLTSNELKVSEIIQLLLFDLPPLITVEQLHLSMPCGDDLWQCNEFCEWKRIKNIQEGPQRNHNVLDILRIGSSDPIEVESLSDSALWISILAFYAVQRQPCLQRLSGPPKVGPESLEDQTSSSPGCFRVSEQGIEHIDPILERFQEATQRRDRNSKALHTVGKFCRIFRVLAFIPYRLMYVGSGWMTTGKDADATAKRIALLLRSKPKQARKSFLHAAELFTIIRLQTEYEPYDSFFLLMSTLYIWYFDRFIVRDQQTQNTTIGKNFQILRFDQIIGEDTHKRWIEGEPDVVKKVYVAGIGVLDGQESVSRILRETSRILGHDKAWSKQANAIQRSLQQLLSGESPSFDA